MAVLETHGPPRRGWTPFEQGRDFTFSAEPIRRSTLADWEEVVQDAMAVSAAVEYADYTVKRPADSGERHLFIDVPVHEPERWNAPAVVGSMRNALSLLTGDSWQFSFRAARVVKQGLRQKYLSLDTGIVACMPYSSGLDSLAVAHLERQRYGDGLLLVRVQEGVSPAQRKKAPFVGVPYSISYRNERKEPSGRSRGFKFALVSGLAAYLADAPKVLFPESGQGAIGPAIVNVGTTYPDYRNHPLFAACMETFLKALLRWEVQYEFPRLWKTKGETLLEFVQLPNAPSWDTTRSCWRDSRWSSVSGKRRQCGICAACMLRRVSVHAAGQREASETYVAVNMDAPSLDAAVDPAFRKLNAAYRKYAIAGVLHMKNMADLAERTQRDIVKGHAALLGPVLGKEVDIVERGLLTMFEKHSEEWENYLGSLDKSSFVRSWSAVA